jgi:hypothetical protein
MQWLPITTDVVSSILDQGKVYNIMSWSLTVICDRSVVFSVSTGFPPPIKLTATILYSSLMGVQAIDQNIFPEVLGMTKVFYCPRSTTGGNRTLWSFPIPRGKLFSIFKYCFTILTNNTNYLFHNKHEDSYFLLFCACF